MALHSIWDGAAPPGTYTMYSDGTPSITCAHQFYVVSSNPAEGGIAGVGVWIPVAGTSIPPRVRVKVWTDGGTTDPPTVEKVVDITADRGSWQTVMFDELVALPTVGTKINVFSQFEGATSDVTTYDAYYTHNPAARASAAAFVASPTYPNLVWSETVGGEHGQLFRSPRGGSVEYPGSGVTGYGIDLIISDTLDPEDPEDPEDPVDSLVGAINDLATRTAEEFVVVREELADSALLAILKTSDIESIVKITQAAYDALDPKVSTRLYVIVG